jgi:pentatricopeptide repeat protein
MKQCVIIVCLLLAGCATTTVPKVDKAKMAEGYYLKGMSYFQGKNYELASVEFNRSIQSDESYKQSYYMLGIISDYQGKLDDAIKYYKEAIDRDPDYSEAYNALGTVYSKQRKWKDALKFYKKALENKLYPTPHVPYLNIGRLYMAQKDYNKAVDAYREAKRYANQDFIIYELGTALFDAGKIKEAVNEFREGVGIAPQNANLRFSLALALLKDGNKKGALAEFKKASELAPGSDVAQKAKDYIQTLR